MRIIYTLFSALLLASTLHAEVQLTTLTTPKVLDSPGEQIPLDIDGNGETDFLFFYDVYLGNPYLHINMTGNALYTSKVVVTGQKNIYGKDLVAAVAEGAGIGPSSKYNGTVVGNGPLVAQPTAAGGDILEGRGEVYVGIRFVGSTGTHYGWIALEVNSAGTSATIRAYAWQTETDTPITVTAINQSTPVTAIAVVGEKGDRTITEAGGTLRMIAEITPEDATNQEVTWSLSPDGLATIDEAGLLTAVANGEVTVTATATDGSGVSGSTTVLIVGQPVAVTSITVRSESGATEITEDMGSLRLIADVMPTDATEKDVTWSVDDERIATIDGEGLLTAIRNGTVIATATATDGSGVLGSLTIEVSGQSTMSVGEGMRVGGNLNLR